MVTHTLARTPNPHDRARPRAHEQTRPPHKYAFAYTRTPTHTHPPGPHSQPAGTCRIVEYLQAPGFYKAYTQHPLGHDAVFNDASMHINGSLTIKLKTSSSDYAGFKIAFSAPGVPTVEGSHSAYGTFKAPFTVADTDEVQTVTVPFTDFSWDWSDYTGSCESVDPTGLKHHCCSEEEPEYCPTSEYLSQINGLELWAEGCPTA